MPTDKLQTLLRFTWHHRSVGAFLFIHKYIYRRVNINKRYANVVNVLGVADVITVQKWFSLRDAVSKHIVKVWLTLVKDMNWSDDKTHFTVELSDQWQVDGEERVINHPGPYEKHIQYTDLTVLSTYTPNTLTANRNAAAKNKANTFLVKKIAKKVERRVSNKDRKYKSQEYFMVNMVKDWRSS